MRFRNGSWLECMCMQLSRVVHPRKKGNLQASRLKNLSRAPPGENSRRSVGGLKMTDNALPASRLLHEVSHAAVCAIEPKWLHSGVFSIKVRELEEANPVKGEKERSSIPNWNHNSKGLGPL